MLSILFYKQVKGKKRQNVYFSMGSVYLLIKARRVLQFSGGTQHPLSHD